MTGILVIAHAVLWTGLIVLLAIVYALTRHISVLFERIALGVGSNTRGDLERLLEDKGIPTGPPHGHRDTTRNPRWRAGGTANECTGTNEPNE